MNLDTQKKTSEVRSMKSASKPKEKKKYRICNITHTKTLLNGLMRFRRTFDAVSEAEFKAAGKY